MNQISRNFDYNPENSVVTLSLRGNIMFGIAMTMFLPLLVISLFSYRSNILLFMVLSLIVLGFTVWFYFLVFREIKRVRSGYYKNFGPSQPSLKGNVGIGVWSIYFFVLKLFCPVGI